MKVPRPPVLMAALVLGGCAQHQAAPPTPEAPRHAQRIEQLTRERQALQAEIGKSRRALSELESELGRYQRALAYLADELRPVRSRADVVSALADARVALDRVGEDAASWEGRQIDEGREQLAEAERQLSADRVGSALFFVLRARHMAAEIREYRERLAGDGDTRFVQVEHANVRTEPSMDGAVATVLDRATPIRVLGNNDDWLRILAPGGQYGWIYARLIGDAP